MSLYSVIAAIQHTHATVIKSLSNKTVAAERGYAAEYRPMQPRQPIYSASVLQFPRPRYNSGTGVTPVTRYR